MNWFTAVESLMSNAEVRWVAGLEHRVAVELSEGLFMSVKARVAPRVDSLMLVARPIPLPAPVIKMTLFWNEAAICRLFLGIGCRKTPLCCFEVATFGIPHFSCQPHRYFQSSACFSAGPPLITWNRATGRIPVIFKIFNRSLPGISYIINVPGTSQFAKAPEPITKVASSHCREN